MITSLNIQNLTNKFLRSVNRIFLEALYFFDSHFTYLSILLIGIIGTIIFFISSYLCRYRKYDFWRWKSRALFKSISFWLILILIKGAIQILK